ncbi:MAG: hypothetical protein JJU28_17570 [Cyclobacteriaceae bacterium]|nr:hypothetical protein [Cyclobacteriaceae bacterium]
MKNQLLSELSSAHFVETSDNILIALKKTITFILVLSFCFNISEGLFLRYVSGGDLSLPEYLFKQLEEIIAHCMEWLRFVFVSEKDAIQYLLEWLISIIAFVFSFFKGLICLVW